MSDRCLSISAVLYNEDMSKKLTEKEIDAIVTTQADDESAWGKPVKITRFIMKKLTILEVKPLEKYRLWLKFSDQTNGEVDLSHLAGKGVFAFWNVPGNFEQVRLESGRRIAWNAEIDMDADALYLQLTGKQPADLFPALKEDPAYA